MKKAFAAILSLVILATAFAACSKNTETPTEPENGNNQVVNPISDITAEDMAKELGLKEIKLENITYTSKINGEDIIYSIDVTKDGVEYNIRLAKTENNEQKDISGVYVSEKADHAIFDSADVEKQASISVDKDSEYIKAAGEWNNFNFSVSATAALSLEDMQKTTVEFTKPLISADNIL